LDDFGNLIIDLLPRECGVFDLSGLVGDTLCLGRLKICSKQDHSDCGCDLGIMDPRHKLLNRAPLGCNNPNQPGARFVVMTTHPVWVVRQCACNCEQAIVKRHGAKQIPITTDFDVAVQYLNCIIQKFSGEVANIARLFQFREWLAKWPLGKRRKILLSMMRDPVLPGRVRSFIKREIYHSRPKRPRLIQAYPNLATQASCAVEFFQAQKALAAVWSPISDPIGRIHVTFACGMNASELGRWMTDTQLLGRVKWYERDGVSWDARQQLHHFLMKYMLCACLPDLVRFMQSCVVVRGNARTGHNLLEFAVRYVLDGTVKSGHNDTSFGNSLVNALVLIQSFRGCPHNIRILVMGDDCLVAVYGDFDEHRIANEERACGIDPEYRAFHDYRDVSFASGIWYPTVDGYIFGPKLGRLLRRLGATTASVSPKQYDAWITCVVQGLWSVVGGLPGFTPWLCRVLDGPSISDDQRRAWFDHDLHQFRATSEVQYIPAIRSWFCDRYGLLDCELTHVEDLLIHFGLAPVMVIHPLFEKIVFVDTCDIAARPLSL
jgi:hypothetical protein